MAINKICPFPRNHEHPQRKPSQSCETPKREVRDVILCTSDPIHINFLQSWMAIGQDPPPFRICINLTSNFFGAAPLAEKVEFLWREPPLVIRGDQFSNWSVASPSSFSFHWMLFPALSIPVQWRSGCGSLELEQWRFSATLLDLQKWISASLV